MDMSNANIVTTEMIFHHMDHIVSLFGIDHVGYGSDWIPDITFTADGLQAPMGQLIFPDGGYTTQMGAKGVPTRTLPVRGRRNAGRSENGGSGPVPDGAGCRADRRRGVSRMTSGGVET